MADPVVPVVTPLRLVNALLRHRRWMIAGALVLATAVALYSLVRPARYTSTSAIIPQQKSPTSGLTGLASQLGLTLPTESGAQQPAFYVELLTSAEMLRRVALVSYPAAVTGERRPLTLVDLYEGDRKDKGVALKKTVERLSKRVNVVLSAKTGIVYTSVSARRPELAQAINRTLLQQVDSFNRASRRGQAGAERQFAEARVNEAIAELRVAENRLQGFLETNRAFRNSPVLTFEQDRLARDVSTKQQLFTTLVQAYEQARTQEVRDTPVFSVLEAPTFPPQADSLHLIRNLLASLVLGAALGLLLGSIASASRRSPEFYSDLQEFRQLRRVGRP